MDAQLLPRKGQVMRVRVVGQKILGGDSARMRFKAASRAWAFMASVGWQVLVLLAVEWGSVDLSADEPASPRPCCCPTARS
ncbi:MAG: hypothetical protein DWI21_07350 [Planctomycetota bacterium]|nr:MAG: hypothetical protein DWI21_07350 [Planctomycetota bacterium]